MALGVSHVTSRHDEVSAVDSVGEYDNQSAASVGLAEDVGDVAADSDVTRTGVDDLFDLGGSDPVSPHMILTRLGPADLPAPHDVNTMHCIAFTPRTADADQAG